MFVFGDSYTRTGFNISLAQPSRENPLGNPAYPGYTSSNGPNWIDFLTTTHNRSFISTINLSAGGATVDSSLVAPYLPSVPSVKQQIELEYLPTYATPSPPVPWEAKSTLFAIFIGINDVHNSYQSRNATLAAAIFAVYADQVARLYASGARNFLFLTVPPIDRSPATAAAGPDDQVLEAAAVADWNARVGALARHLVALRADAAAFVFDVHRLFASVLDAPCSFAQTCAIKNTTDFCAAYEGGTAGWYDFDQTCGVAVDEYFWLNGLHPTFRVHNVTAEMVARELSSGRRGGYKRYGPPECVKQGNI
jgi:phospholipase/lecithinase/hemolysin